MDDEVEIVQRTDQKFLERWANLYTLTRSIPSDEHADVQHRRFNIQTWGSQAPKSECGTAACVAGHAALHPWFRERGLMAEFRGPNMNILIFDKDELQEDYWMNIFFGVNECTDEAGEFLPFWPSVYRELVAELADEDDLYRMDEDDLITKYVTPDVAADAVYQWMLSYWPTRKVDEAIAAATTKYDIEAVHRYTPWNNDHV